MELIIVVVDVFNVVVAVFLLSFVSIEVLELSRSFRPISSYIVVVFNNDRRINLCCAYLLVYCWFVFLLVCILLILIIFHI